MVGTIPQKIWVVIFVSLMEYFKGASKIHNYTDEAGGVVGAIPEGSYMGCHIL